MATFEVRGGNPLYGVIYPQGAKNEALQILCAVLLTSEKVTVHNIPRILDVMKLIELLGKMGVEVEQLSPSSYTFQARNINFEYMESIEYKKDRSKLRGAIMIVGHMLAS